MSPSVWSPCDLPGVSAVCGVPGAVAGGLFDSIAQEFAKAATSVLEALLNVVETTTSVDATAGWFMTNYRTVSKVGLSALLILFFVQLLSSAIQRKPRGLARAVTGTATALLGTAVLVGVTEAALLVTDDVTKWIAGTGQDPLRRMLAGLFPMTALPATGGALLLVGSLLVLIGTFVLWAVLLFRKVAIYLVLVFAPIALAGQAWEGSHSWARRLLHALAALILCKVAIVTVFVLGASAAAYGDGLSTFLGGIILLGVACFAPWMTFRLLHFVDLAIAHDHYSMLRATPMGAPVRTASTAVDRVQRLASMNHARVVPGRARLGSASPPGSAGGTSTASAGASTSSAGAAAGAAGAAAAAPVALRESERRGAHQVADRLDDAWRSAGASPSSPAPPPLDPSPFSGDEPPTNPPRP